MSSRNAPPWGGALRDDTENGCVADYLGIGSSNNKGIQEIFACGIRNAAHGIRNPINHLNPESKFH